MARKTDVFGGTGNDTVIGSTVKLKGNLSSEGDISIDGRMAGNVKSGGAVNIGVNAQIVGDVTAGSIVVGGRLDGNIKVSDSAVVLSTGQVHGDINAARLEVAMGGIFIGSSKMKAAEASEVMGRTEADPE